MTRSESAVLIARAVCVAFAFVLTGIEADNHLAYAARALADEQTLSSTLAWWPIVLLAISILPVLFSSHSGARLGAGGSMGEKGGTGDRRLTIFVIAICGVALIRVWVAGRGPMTGLASREIMDIVIAGLFAVSLASLARRAPLLALRGWTACLVVILLARLLVYFGSPESRTAHFVFTPDVLPLFLSLLWVGFVSGGAPSGSIARTARSARGRPGGLRRPAWAFAFQVGALASGCLVAWICVRYSNNVLAASSGGDSRLFDHTSLLWSRSVGLGWGRAVVLRLLNVMAEPGAPHTISWLGTRGLMAAYGAAAPIAGAMISLVVLRSTIISNSLKGDESRPMALLAPLAFHFLIGMIVVGGPNSSIPLLLAAGWLALCMGPDSSRADPVAVASHTRANRRESALRLAAVGVALAGVSILVVWSYRPIAARRILVSLHSTPFDSPGHVDLIDRAHQLDPHNPRVELARAAMARDRLNRSAGWDEALYVSIEQAYESAIALDPFDAANHLALAQVQILADRTDDALRTARRGLVHLPNSRELLDWLYVTSVSKGRSDLARTVIERRRLLSPGDFAWWARRGEAYRAAGRRERALAASGAALTAAVGSEAEAEAVREAFARRGPSSSD